MTCLKAALLFAGVLVSAASALQAHIRELDDRDISRALTIANASDATRKAFHAPYFVAMNGPVVASMEVITEYRRFVLRAEAERRAGNWMLARGGYDRQGRTLKQTLARYAGTVAIVADLRFHPQNSYVFVPSIEVSLGEPALLPIEIERTPHMAQSRNPAERQAILGAHVEALFNATSVSPDRTPVRVMLDGKEVVRATVDLSRID